MPEELDGRLVIGVASSAVFDLLESDAIFKSEGEEKISQVPRVNLSHYVMDGRSI